MSVDFMFPFNGDNTGLTKRELFAAMAMQAANATIVEPERLAEIAVVVADALIAELAKGGGDE